MDPEEKKRQEQEELIEMLDSIKGRHTELVTVMIPAGYSKDSVVRQLETEAGTAENIKSKQTRTAVVTALETIVRELRNIKSTPKNGLAIFCGNISEKEGAQDIQLFSIEPLKPLNVRLYRCDQTFILDPLKEMLEIQEVYGLLVIDRQVATIGLLEGKRIVVLRTLTSGMPGKFRAGGQSAARFSRLNETLAKDFYRRVADGMKEIFFDMPKLKGMLIGGPIPTKEDFLEEGQLVTKIKEKVIAVKDIGYVDEHGLKLLVEASQEDMANQEFMKEKKLLTKFFDTLGKYREKASYGEEETKIALERGAVEILLISKKLSKEKIKEFEQLAESIGSEVHFISQENQDGEQFQNLTKGIGAILRFPIK